jgi:hypothetical protein
VESNSGRRAGYECNFAAHRPIELVHVPRVYPSPALRCAPPECRRAGRGAVNCVLS